jgi:hypothetical protein
MNKALIPLLAQAIENYVVDEDFSSLGKFSQLRFRTESCVPITSSLHAL